jgi:hypothetical protein
MSDLVLNPIWDTVISESNLNESLPSTSSTLIMGDVGTGIFSRQRALMKFDFSSVSGVIDKAELLLYARKRSTGALADILGVLEFYRMKKDPVPDETTWLYQNLTTLWEAPGTGSLDREDSPFAIKSNIVHLYWEYYTVDLTEEVLWQIENDNYGWMIKLPDSLEIITTEEWETFYVQMYSTEGLSRSPKLSITYKKDSTHSDPLFFGAGF